VTLAGKTVYATNTIGAKSLAVAADAKLIVGGTGDDVLAETAAEGPKFGLKIVNDCSITGRVAVGGKDLTVPARLVVGGNLTSRARRSSPSMRRGRASMISRRFTPRRRPSRSAAS